MTIDSTMTEMNFSQEQQSVIDAVHTGYKHVVVDAVAGCGKTTTILGIAMANTNKNVLCLTYNRTLCDESKDRARELGITNLNMYTVHGFVYGHYSSVDNTDRIFHLTLNGNLKPKRDIHFDIIVLDEYQDFHGIMVRIALKTMKDSKWNVSKKLVLLGDKYQCVYDTLHDSDERFLTFAPQLMPFLGDFSMHNLHTTFRLTNNTCDFINDGVLSSSLLVPFKTSPHKPIYLVTNPYSRQFYHTIITYLQEHGATSSDIFILAPSVKTDNSPVRKLADQLSKKSYNIYISDNLDNKTDPRQLQDHVCVTTYHSCKGRERRFVIMFGFDGSYFDYNARDKERDTCTNAQYVALTRSTEHLIVVHSNTKEYLEFVNRQSLSSLCDMRILDNLEITKDSKKPINNGLSVTELLDYQSFSTLLHCESYYSEVEIDCLESCVLPTVVQSIGGKNEEIFEGVSDLNGTLVTVLYEYRRFKRFSILKFLEKEMERHTRLASMQNPLPYLPHDIAKHIAKLLQRTRYTIADVVKMVLLAECCDHKTSFRMKQLDKAKMWLTTSDEKNIIELFNSFCSDNCEFEKDCMDSDIVRGRRLHGKTDIIDHTNKIVTEVKCVDTLTASHKTQLMCYAYLMQKSDVKYKNYKYMLYNVRDGRRLIITPNANVSLQMMVDYLIFQKYHVKKRVSDEDFLNEHVKGLQEFWNDL